MTDCLLRGKRFFCREWAFAKLAHCLDTRPTSKTPGTLIMGGPGCGKTALCSEVVWPTSAQARQADLKSRLLAYHFCQAHDSSSLSVTAFIRSLVAQVSASGLVSDFASPFPCGKARSASASSASGTGGAGREPGVASPLLGAGGVKDLLDPRECETNADEAFKVAFLEPLHACEPPEQSLMLWIDSVDESYYLQPATDSSSSSFTSTATTADGDAASTATAGGAPAPAACSQTIAELLATHSSSLPPWLLLVCSARKQSKVVTRMFTGFRKLSLDDLRKSHVVRDVQQYILCRLDAEDGLRQHLSRDTAEMLNQLHIKSNGCFLYLEKVLDGVAESFIMLREVRDIPGTLNGLYLWLCQRLFVKKHVVKIRPVLNVLLASRAPLSNDELFECLLTRETDLTREEYERRMRIMSRILFNGPNGELIVFHHSFAEWLLDVKHCTQKYLCDAGEGHAMIAARQLQRAKDLTHSQVQDLALHLVRGSGFQPEHSVQMLILSGAGVDRCLAAGIPKDARALRLLCEAGARMPTSLMEASTTSLESALNVEEDQGSSEEMGAVGDVVFPEDIDELDANGRTQLHTAAYRGDMRRVEALLSRSAALEPQDRSGQTALTLASRQGHATIVTALLKAGAQVDHADRDGWTALRSAAWAGHTGVVTMLLKQGAQVDHADSEQRTALRAACWGGHEEIVQLLLDAGADSNRADYEGRTALIAAAYMGHEDIVALLLDRGAQIDREDCDGRTALSVACLCVPASAGHERVVSLLLERGAAVDHTDRDGSTPLLVAAYEGHPGVCELLLEWDADADHSDAKCRTPLWAAASMGHEQVVRQLLFWGAAVDHIDSEGRTVLCVAAAQGSPSVVRQLLDRGLDEMHRDNSGWTPLHLAAYEGHMQVCSMLLDQGAKVNEVDNDGRVALIQAAQEGHLEIVQHLVEAGSTVNHRSHDGKTALRVAAVEGHAQVVNYLLSAGADINYEDADGRTTLYVLALDGNVPMTRLLLTRGALVEAVDVEGRTALHVAAWQGNAQVVKALVQHGAQVNSEDNDRRTAVQSASWQGHEDVVRILLEAGASADHTCNQGATALCIAAQEGHEDVVRTLLAFRANPNHADQFGRTPYRVALKSGHQRVCKILEDFGAVVPTGVKSRSNSSSASSGVGGVGGGGGEIKIGNAPANSASPMHVATTGPSDCGKESGSLLAKDKRRVVERSVSGTECELEIKDVNTGAREAVEEISRTREPVPAKPSSATAAATATSTIMALTGSPELPSERRKSYHSYNSKTSSTKSSSNLTSSTNQSGGGAGGGGGNLSRLDRECLTFTQQLQQCSMGKNRSRPISRVLSPVSEPQSPVAIRSPSSNHAPPIPPHPPAFSDSAASRLGPGADSTGGYCEIHTGLGVQIISSGRKPSSSGTDPIITSENALSPPPPPLPPKGPGLSLNRTHALLSSNAPLPSSMSSSSAATASGLQGKPERRVSATINIITNPHADMMSSVEEPVWQRNPAHPSNGTSTSNHSASNAIQPSNGSYVQNYHNHYIHHHQQQQQQQYQHHHHHHHHQKQPHHQHQQQHQQQQHRTNGTSASSNVSAGVNSQNFHTACSSSSSSSGSHLDVSGGHGNHHHLHQHHHQQPHSSTGSSPSRIIMGQSSLANKSPERRWKRNGIVTNPKAMHTSAGSGSTNNAKSMSSSNSSSTNSNTQHQYHRYSAGAAATTSTTLISPTSPTANGHARRASFSPTTSPTNGYGPHGRKTSLPEHLSRPGSMEGRCVDSHSPALSVPRSPAVSQPALYELDHGQQAGVKPIRPNGLPIKKVNSPRYH